MSATLENLGITADTIRAYDQRIPRYTSYPTAPYFSQEFGPEQWREHLQKHGRENRKLSLYVHIPFCWKRCLFCACNVIVSRKPEVSETYLDVLQREIDLLKKYYDGSGEVIQLHWGGGTPNYLTQAQMKRLVDMLEKAFPFAPDAERGIEVDPREATPEDVRFFHDELGFDRISFGVQDFNTETQTAIGRGQTLDCTQRNTQASREAGYDSVNFDLIYGLPHQSEASWLSTIDGIVDLRPDRIALYNFAFLPGRLAHQKYLETESLPSPETKLQMFIDTHNRLTSDDWVFIGMDHYALKDDSLTLAQQENTLHRNFMGYTTLRGTDMLAFGVSSISDFDGAYAQNVKKLTQHRRMVEAGDLPVERGLVLTDDDKIRRYIIEEIMCNTALFLDADPGVPGADVRAIVNEERDRLEPLEKDGLIRLTEDALIVTQKGRLFLRNIAVVFDSYLKTSAEKPTFSRAV